ncbi:membrane protein [Rhodopirellula maiorica SM1]|uniref:Membrane protein n=1 Tax=Rhodopirellula maiorica SM1 TaxID=1265738 RepID=M5RQV9_9BACT|nr:hypothetical protein [Rhodopirellula maiorica]EMI17767.1 membrane protein [Rhodopirellula maiorica SM1]
MTDRTNDEPPALRRAQFSLRFLFKSTTYCGMLMYWMWRTWDHLGIGILVLVLMAPFIFFAEIVDYLLSVKRS